MREIDNPITRRLAKRFHALYGPARAARCLERLLMMLGRYGVSRNRESPPSLWSERDILLITYGDTVRDGEEPPLATLDRFLAERVLGVVNSLHILPFSPSSSDDGFSVVDYREVDPELGTWDHIRAIASRYRLMADLVLNHCSRRSAWFKDYEKGIAPGRHFFIEVESGTDLSAVVRPRTSPLLTEANSVKGTRFLWTTFSPDQMDLNFANPDVLFEFLDLLFFYISAGVKIFRLDAIAYLWKQIGTSCIHLPETHEVVKIFRDILELLDRGIILLTETNVPHEENVAYFGNSDEAHAVYQFPLPPLLLHALQTGDGTQLTRWARALDDPPRGCAFLNFTASHDGIGLRPLEGLIPAEEVARMAERVKRMGGGVSARKNPDGGETPYELNITYLDALCKQRGEESDQLLGRFLCSQTIALALKGIPAIYFQSLVGGRNDCERMTRTGRARSINRKKWELGELAALLDNPASFQAKIFAEMRRRIEIRTKHRVFHPNARQIILDLDRRVFAFLRISPRGNQSALCLHNLTARPVEIAGDKLLTEDTLEADREDLLTGKHANLQNKISLAPYQAAWLAASPRRNRS